MILRILLLCASAFAMDERHSIKEKAQKHVTDNSKCYFGVACLGVACAVGLYFYYQYEEGQLKNYNNSPMEQPILIPANYQIDWATDAGKTCVKMLTAGLALTVKNWVPENFKELVCVPSVRERLKNCISADNYAKAYDKTCTKEIAAGLRADLKTLFKKIDMADAETFRVPQYPTGFKIIPNPVDMTFKTPNPIGCVDPLQTPGFDMDYCGEHAVMEVRPSDISFFNGPTKWKVNFPLVKLNKVVQGLTIENDTSDMKYLQNALEYFKRDLLKMSLNGKPIARARVQYINGADWYKQCKDPMWTVHKRPSPSWDSKCSLSTWYPSYSGDMPVSVSIESYEPSRSGKTYFRAHAKYDASGIFSNSKTTVVYECTRQPIWNGKASDTGCTTVLQGKEETGSGSPVLKVLKDSGVDPSALIAYYFSELYTRNMRHQYEHVYHIDLNAHESYEQKKEARAEEARQAQMNRTKQ